MKNEMFNQMLSLPHEFRTEMEKYITESNGTFVWKMQNFTRFVPRQSLSRFLCRAELFKKILNLHGSIIELGVLGGFGLCSWAQLSSIYEPMNVNRKVIGFDTFRGFPSVSDNDTEAAVIGDMACDSYEEILTFAKLFNTNRFFGNIEKIELVKGDILETIPAFLAENPHIVISLIYLDVDLYMPTKTALSYFLPRIPKGGVIAFDELNVREWKGESIALNEVIGFDKLKIERFGFEPNMSFAVIGNT